MTTKNIFSGMKRYCIVCKRPVTEDDLVERKYTILHKKCADLVHFTDNELKRRAAHLVGTTTHVGEGWTGLVVNLVQLLNKLSPEWQMEQIKEKFGTLNFYCAVNELGRIAVNLTERVSGTVCEVCGELGELDFSQGWTRALCPDHTARVAAEGPPGRWENE